MKITTPISLFGFLLALSALNAPTADASSRSSVPPSTDTAQTIDSRLSKLSAAIRQRETLLSTGDPDNSTISPDILLARAAWGNGGGGAFRNGGGGGAFRNGGGAFVNGGGFRNGGFINNPWGNGWRNGGGFYNYR
ncbi:MAG: GrrA/OscA1 family cyclophane-containing rSAM-modified RiPP [Gloeobacterales cyanobacterium]